MPETTVFDTALVSAFDGSYSYVEGAAAGIVHMQYREIPADTLRILRIADIVRVHSTGRGYGGSNNHASTFFTAGVYPGSDVMYTVPTATSVTFTGSNKWKDAMSRIRYMCNNYYDYRTDLDHSGLVIYYIDSTYRAWITVEGWLPVD